MKSKIIIKGKTAFYLFIFVCSIIILTVWITGLNIHRTITNNAIYSLTIITVIFFAFVSYGLYQGVKLTDNFGSIKSKIGSIEPTGISGDIPMGDFSIGEYTAEGIEGIIVGIFLWIAILLLAVIFMFFFETIVYAGLIIFTGIFYWIFYRATRLILRYSRWTKGNLNKSLWVGFRYSIMYSAWLYALVWIIQEIKK